MAKGVTDMTDAMGAAPTGPSPALSAMSFHFSRRRRRGVGGAVGHWALRLLPALALAAALAGTSSAALTISDGASAIHSASNELSGITWAGGDLYYAVDDRENALYRLNLTIGDNGSISCSLGESVRLRHSHDTEGCAWDPCCGTVWVAMERTQTPIREYDPATGAALRSAPLPALMVESRRLNYGLEALTISRDGMEMWTCNEEALTVDGPRSTVSAGSVVRLTRFTREVPGGDWKLDGQWAYQTEPLRHDSSLASSPRSGVAGLCALPDGTLLVLEREFSGASISSAIFAVDFGGAADISQMPSLEGAVFSKVGKKCLWRRGSRISVRSRPSLLNYEGICLGPGLGEDADALVIIADAGIFGKPCVSTLILRGLGDTAGAGRIPGLGAGAGLGPSCGAPGSGGYPVPAAEEADEIVGR